MFHPNRPVIDAFIAHCLTAFTEAFPARDAAYLQTLEQAATLAMETLQNCDCPYHDMQHTMLVTDAGQSILRGRLLAEGNVTPDDWLHVIIALLCHDLGYVRGLLKDDEERSYVADENGNRVQPPPGATDAYLTPYHVTRGCLFVQERFAAHPLVDVDRLSSYVEMTRFPVPEDDYYQQTGTFAALVRAADLIGQMGDPQYIQKLSRLFAEFKETGEAERLGYDNAGDLRSGFPDFFYDRVYPYLGDGLRHLRRTAGGREWIAHLFQHVQNEQSAEPGFGPERQPGKLASIADARARRDHLQNAPSSPTPLKPR